MKPKNLITTSLLFISLICYSQVIENADFISPENEGLIAVKKGENWSFINSNAETVIKFRTDLVAMSNNDGDYPIFINDRCLIRKKVDNQYYYGFIDQSGKTVIEPEFLYATSFKNGKAIILKKVTEKMGENKVLGKNVIATKLEEYVIDTSGKTIKFLSSRNYVPKRIGAKSQLKIYSKFISDHLVAVQDRNNKWSIVKM